jgi:uncharacterized protein YijF (DUF1287 family)
MHINENPAFCTHLRGIILRPRANHILILTVLLLSLALSWHFLTGHYPSEHDLVPADYPWTPSAVERIPVDQLQTADLILLGARAEAKNATSYDASYQVMAYPGGDVAPDRGACTDVVIRAYRKAGIDLQALIHQDMLHHFGAYPQRWGLKGPDHNIDHRRVPNQITFFQRHGRSLTLENYGDPQQWQWGDVVYWRFANGDEHCGIVSDRKTRDNIPLVIHNASICREEDALLRWKIIGHYRYP